jgi:hypothetical protein
VDRRALLGGVVGAAAAGVVGYGVGAASAQDGDSSDAGRPPADAASVAVEPTGELVAEDVQTALVDVFERTGATAGLTDLKVAYQLVDDFAPTAADHPGQLGWFTEASGPGAGVVAAPPQEGGVIRLSTGTSGGSRAGIHLGLDQQVGSPVFTMGWRIRIDKADDADAAIAFGALASIDSAVGGGPGPGMWFVYDPAEKGSTWWCRCAAGGEVTEVDTGRDANSQAHRFAITSDGAGLIRFWYDDAEVAAISDTVPGEDDRYGQGLVIASRSQATNAVADIDWFYLRRELPR